LLLPISFLYGESFFYEKCIVYCFYLRSPDGLFFLRKVILLEPVPGLLAFLENALISVGTIE
jgi:hypothetical protein